MKLFEHFNFASMLGSIGLTIKGMVTNPAFLLLSSSTVGFIQVFNYRKDLTIDLLVATGICFTTMTFLGLVKHYKTGEAKAEIFVKKTIEQFVVMVSVVLLGYIASIIIAVVFKIVTQAVAGANPVPGMALYFIFAGYGVMFTYYFIKSCDLIDQILPNLLPKWYSAPFRKFRNSGDYKDLLSFASKEEETKVP
ncbi:hypothetical protein [Dyadobacter chenhuakuii]|uniref:Uncharacterized protein n=1 Tax=Dyadobacter chenhuakuii TaxID=2909339 RepID=A0A9X1TRW2_9BACT|nr:hypothetical protein [Dyadobacter chenhuakuii]MCF2498384.1 hypothetical protein [Dyadobacter chenhuakuii]